MRYAVYISGNGNAIKWALEKNKELKRRIKIIISDNADNYHLKQYYEEKGILFFLFDFNSYRYPEINKNEIFSDFMLELFIKNKIDYCLCFGNHLLKGKLLERYAYHIINFHPALLPKYKGINAVKETLNDKQNFIGNTVHFIDDGIDSGEIILQDVILIDEFKKKGYKVLLEGQALLILKIDELLISDKIKIIDGKVVIENADYSVQHVYPQV